MASVRFRDGRYEVVWVSGGRERSRSFGTDLEAAERYEARIEAARVRRAARAGP